MLGLRTSAQRMGTMILAAGLLAVTGCEPAVRDQFRNATVNGFQNGLTALLGGLVDGLIAIYEPDEGTTDGTGGTGGTDTSGGDGTTTGST